MYILNSYEDYTVKTKVTIILAICDSNCIAPELVSENSIGTALIKHRDSQINGLGTGDKDPYVGLTKPTQNLPHLLSM